MQSDIVIKKPPVTGDITARPAESPVARQQVHQPPQETIEQPMPVQNVQPVQQEPQAIDHAIAHHPEVPIGAISAALVVCLVLVFVAVYGSLS